MTNFLYKEAKAEIVQLIRSGVVDSSGKIPSQRELALRLGFSRMSIKKAIDSLIADNVLVAKRGDGTYLISDNQSKALDIGEESALSLSESIKLKGLSSESLIKSFKLIYDDQYLMKLFPEYFEFYELIRVRKADNRAVSLQKAYFPFRLFKDAHRYDFSNLSLYDFMEYRGKRPVTFKSTIRAVRVTDELDFSELNVRSGSHVLGVDYLGYSATGELVEYTQSYFNPDSIQFKVSVPLREDK
ncbi:GntR family transcriptional regulator [Lacticaseibacillus suibinensis]|uniref:GntR family transcriptional regulator n=1 Tax=Lacticaseibacillus suibinensis TaxID=2486011 RepID=UPI000F7AACC5|nr:GntR family transcriptional regulator [Lacticaseibacillus suibinensis]